MTPDNPHYSLGEQLLCVSETRPDERMLLTVRAAAGGGSFASVWAVTAEDGGRPDRLLAARTAWAPNHWMTDHGDDLRRLDRYREIVELTRPADPQRAVVTGADEVIPGLVTHYGLYVSAHAGRGQDVYVALMPYFPHTVAQLVGARGDSVSTRVGPHAFTAAAQPQGFPPAVALGHARTVAQGIRALHDREIIHRDISCDNTLVRADGTLVVGDLNLAALLTRGHYRGSLDRGKGFYTPPEMLRAEQAGLPPDLTKASDVWQLGVLFSRLCTGSWPYPTNNTREFEQFALRGPEATGLSPGLRALSDPVRDLVRACLDPRPEARPAVADVLSRLGMPAPLPPMPAPVGVPARGRPAPTRAGTLLASRPRAPRPAPAQRPASPTPRPAPTPARTRRAAAPVRSALMLPVRMVRAILGWLWRLVRNTLIVLMILVVGLVAGALAAGVDPGIVLDLR